MTVNELKNIPEFRLLAEGDMNKEITRPFCCDLLSVAMSKAPAGAFKETRMHSQFPPLPTVHASFWPRVHHSIQM